MRACRRLTEATIRWLRRGALQAQEDVDLFGFLVPMRTCGERREPGLTELAVCAVPADLVYLTAVEEQWASIDGAPFL